MELKDQKEHIEKIKDQNYLDFIRQKYANKDLIRINRQLAKNLKSWSVLFNLVSYSTACYAVYFFASIYAGFQLYFILVLGLILLGTWELAKRFLAINSFEGLFNADESYKRWFGLGLVVAVAVSGFVSYYGGDKFVSQENSGSEHVYNFQIDSINKEIKKAETDKALYTQQTWKGKIVTDARKMMKIQDEKIAALTIQRLKLENMDINKNTQLENEHAAKIANLGLVFGLIAGGCDLFLILFLGWAEKLEWELHCLLTGTGSQKAKKKKTVNNIVPMRQPDNDRVQIRAFRATPAPDHTRPDMDAHAHTHTHAHNAPALAYTRTPVHTRTRTHARECKNCGKEYTGNRRKFCSDDCSKEWQGK